MRHNTRFFSIALDYKQRHTGDGRFSPEKNPKLTNLEKDCDTYGLPIAQSPQHTRALPSNSDLSTSFSCLLNMNDSQGSLCISGKSPILKTETKTKQEC